MHTFCLSARPPFFLSAQVFFECAAWFFLSARPGFLWVHMFFLNGCLTYVVKMGKLGRKYFLPEEYIMFWDDPE